MQHNIIIIDPKKNTQKELMIIKDTIGKILDIDIGKRMFEVNKNIWQAENQEQAQKSEIYLKYQSELKKQKEEKQNNRFLEHFLEEYLSKNKAVDIIVAKDMLTNIYYIKTLDTNDFYNKFEYITTFSITKDENSNELKLNKEPISLESLEFKKMQNIGKIDRFEILETLQKTLSELDKDKEIKKLNIYNNINHNKYIPGEHYSIASKELTQPNFSLLAVDESDSKQIIAQSRITKKEFDKLKIKDLKNMSSEKDKIEYIIPYSEYLNIRTLSLEEKEEYIEEHMKKRQLDKILDHSLTKSGKPISIDMELMPEKEFKDLKQYSIQNGISLSDENGITLTPQELKLVVEKHKKVIETTKNKTRKK
jgi:hypothetical protein